MIHPDALRKVRASVTQSRRNERLSERDWRETGEQRERRERSARESEREKKKKKKMLARLSRQLHSRGLLNAAPAVSPPTAFVSHVSRGVSGGGGDGIEYPPPDAERMGTADICDVHLPDPVDATVPRAVQVCEPNFFKDVGGRRRFHGPIRFVFIYFRFHFFLLLTTTTTSSLALTGLTLSTVKCFENNPHVRAALGEQGNGRVLVVDGGGSKRCALLGDMLAEMGAKNGWSGIIINGCCRDSEDIGRMDIGVKTIGTHPLKSSKRDKGLRDVEVSFAGVTFKPGAYVYADMDGVLVSDTKLSI